MTRLALLFSALALFAPPAHAAPTPDPPPQACQGGWCRVPTVMKSLWIGPMHVPHKRGLWMCHLTGKRTAYCIQVSP